MTITVNCQKAPLIVDLSSNNRGINVQKMADAGVDGVIVRMASCFKQTSGTSEAPSDFIDVTAFDIMDQCYNVTWPDGTKGMPCLVYNFLCYDPPNWYPLPEPEDPSKYLFWQAKKYGLGQRYVNVTIDDVEEYKMADPAKPWSYQYTTDPILTYIVNQNHDWNKLLLKNTPLTAGHNPYCAKQMLYSRKNFIDQFCPSLKVAIDQGKYDLWLAAWLWNGLKYFGSYTEYKASLPTAMSVTTVGNLTENTYMEQLGQIAERVTGSGVLGCTGAIDVNVWVKGDLQSFWDYCGFKRRGAVIPPPPVEVTYTLTGAVTPAIPGVRITLNNQYNLTGTEGQFVLASVPAGTTGSLTPYLTGYTFQPVTIPVNVNSDISSLTFTATKIPDDTTPPVIPANFQAALDAMEARLMTVINRKRNGTFTEI